MSKKIENYIKKNELEGKKIANVLRDLNRGRKELYEICFFYDYPIDKAIAHLDKV